MLVKDYKTDDTENDDENMQEKLQEKLQEIKDQEGIIGYILRGSKSASIDLKDSTNIIDYAVLSSATFDAGRDMTETLQMGEVENIVVESEETKLLSMNVDSYRLTIFMEKSFDHKSLYKNLK
jgi:predicted regulator of Ras-like GTPase activity (Roadblock/LC7/MglB family)